MTASPRAPADRPAGDRAIAGQVDFLTSMVIRVLALGLVLTVGTVLLQGALMADTTTGVVAERAAARLAEDILVTTPGDPLLNATCTHAFFARTPEPCRFDPAWRTGPEPYLATALAVDPARRLNVTITDANGTVAALGPTRLTLGDPVPQQARSLGRWHRQVGLPTDDGIAWRRLTVTVWGR